MKNELNKVESTYQTVLTQGSFLFSQSGYTVLALNRYGRISIHGIEKILIGVLDIIIHIKN